MAAPTTWQDMLFAAGSTMASIGYYIWHGGRKSKQIDDLSENVLALREELAEHGKQNNQILQVLAGMTGRTIDGTDWRTPHHGGD